MSIGVVVTWCNNRIIIELENDPLEKNSRTGCNESLLKNVELQVLHNPESHIGLAWFSLFGSTG
jgi:hypothetical protein